MLLKLTELRDMFGCIYHTPCRRVLNNELHLHQASTAPVVAAKSIDGLSLQGNRIYSPGRPLARSDLVAAVNCSGIRVHNNTVITATELAK